jgi:FMN phosphatase YigB (HAD superfamily)
MRTIVWDVDDVLNGFTREWLAREWLPRRPGCALSYCDLKHNPPHELLGVTLDEYCDSIDRFRDSAAARALQPVPEVRAWFEKHGARFRHVALTARPLASVPSVAEWVFAYFGEWIRAFGFVPSPRSAVRILEYDSTKAGWLEWMRCGDVFVDDNPSNVAAVAALSISTVTIPQPWNNESGSLDDALRRIAALES